MNTYIKDRREEGFTLIELLIAIVVVGILTAVVIVGIGGLANNGEKSACKASLDAARVGAAVHKANTGLFPDAFTTGATGYTATELDVTGLNVGATTITHGSPADWTLTGVFTAGGTAAPTFSCNPA